MEHIDENYTLYVDKVSHWSSDPKNHGTEMFDILLLDVAHQIDEL